MIYNIERKENTRKLVLNYIKENRFKRILDIGGTLGTWTEGFVTHCLDINKNPNSSIPTFIGDINDEDGWKEILKDIETNGEFDFVICSHVLEDIRNPTYVLKKLPQIAKEGYIIGPNKCMELSFIEAKAPGYFDYPLMKSPYRGFFHHRWIMEIDQDKENFIYLLFPKLGFISFIDDYGWVNPLRIGELSFFWKDSIEYKIINDDYLGPSALVAFEFYLKGLKKGEIE